MLGKYKYDYHLIFHFRLHKNIISKTDDLRSRWLKLLQIDWRIRRGGRSSGGWRGARGGGRWWRRLVDRRIVDLRVTDHAHEERTLVGQRSLVAPSALLVQVLIIHT